MSINDEQENQKLPFGKAWERVPKSVRKFLLSTLGSFATFSIGTLGALAMMSHLVTAWLDERDARLDDMKEVVKDYKSGMASGFDEIKVDIRRSADATAQIASDISDIRERLARVEIQTENASNILMSSTQPIVEREFAPILARPTPGGLGGPDYDAVEGFDQMVMTIPYPRNVRDRDAAIQMLTDQHRRYAISVSRPKFDADKYDFAVTQRQILDTDGSIKLELTSTVVE